MKKYKEDKLAIQEPIGEPKRFQGLANKLSDAALFRKVWFDDGVDLVDITQLCEVKINCHGEVNNINEPEEHIYHIKIVYRDEIIANCDGNKIYVIDPEKYCIWIESDNPVDGGFIIFRKINLKGGKNGR